MCASNLNPCSSTSQLEMKQNLTLQVKLFEGEGFNFFVYSFLIKFIYSL